MEIWDIYDRNGLKTGRTIERGAQCQNGEYHKAVHVCLFNSKGSLLIQKRTANKEAWPGLWDVSSGGSVLSGEESRDAAGRETKEELGVEIVFDRPALTMYSSKRSMTSTWSSVILHVMKVKLQESEVAEVRGANERDIREMIKDGSFIPYHVNLIKLLFDLRHTQSIHTR
ncbi:MAG: NUDIX domain-containing protein [Sphaerochaeta sp.]|nr:NUDIX domain-containing protein [Sphaerochaeta sp.]